MMIEVACDVSRDGPNVSKLARKRSMNEDELKDHRKRLEAAINEALTVSPQVGDIIHRIREEGYDVFLIIEATVGFSERGENEEPVRRLPSARLELTTQDQRFLRSLKISPD